MRDYSVYILCIKEKIMYYLAACGLCLTLGYLFFGKAYMAIGLCAASLLFEDKYCDYLKKNRLSSLLDGFKDALYSISASVAAGHQLPVAIKDAADHAKVFYGSGSDIYAELSYILQSYEASHARPEEMLKSLGQRSGLEEISMFAASISICIKNGGNMEELCLKSASLLIEKIDYRMETEALLAEKKLDCVLLLIMPLLVLLFLNLSSYDYVSILYESLKGQFLMTLALLALCLAVIWSLRIMRLEL